MSPSTYYYLGLYVLVQIQLRRIDGWRKIAAVLRQRPLVAA